MKRFLQRIDNGYFYKGPGRYTKDSMEAFEFPDLKSAVERCVRENMGAVYYVLRFEDEHYDVQIPCHCGDRPPDVLETSTFGLGTALTDTASADFEERKHWGHSFNTTGMWINNEGQG